MASFRVGDKWYEVSESYELTRILEGMSGVRTALSILETEFKRHVESRGRRIPPPPPPAPGEVPF